MSANLFVCRVCGAIASRAEARSWAVQGHGKAVCPECLADARLNAKTRSGRSESRHQYYQMHPYDSTTFSPRQGWVQKSRRQRARWRVR